MDIPQAKCIHPFLQSAILLCCPCALSDIRADLVPSFTTVLVRTAWKLCSNCIPVVYSAFCSCN